MTNLGACRRLSYWTFRKERLPFGGVGIGRRGYDLRTGGDTATLPKLPAVSRLSRALDREAPGY